MIKNYIQNNVYFNSRESHFVGFYRDLLVQGLIVEYLPLSPPPPLFIPATIFFIY